MIVLDTNVLSELMRERPDPAVARWMRAQDPAAQFTTAICEAEILYGLALLPAGKRQAALASAAIHVFGGLGGRILPFDTVAAKAFADVCAARRRSGHPIAEADAQIAAIARIHGASVATRDTGDFRDCGIAAVSPWDE